MATVSAGKWVWNESLKTLSSEYVNVLSPIDIDFTSNGKRYISFSLTNSGTSEGLQLKYVDDENPDGIIVYDYDKNNDTPWIDGAYRTMIFATELELTDDQRYVFTENASKPLLKYTKLYREDNLPYNILEAADDAGMTALEADENSTNKLVKFTGTDSSTYDEGRLYIMVQPIQFTIIFSAMSDAIMYGAEEGMTWGEWVKSAYNCNDTLAFTANTSNITISHNNGSAVYEISDVGADDEIIDGNTYTAGYVAGGA